MVKGSRVCFLSWELKFNLFNGVSITFLFLILTLWPSVLGLGGLFWAIFSEFKSNLFVGVWILFVLDWSNCSNRRDCWAFLAVFREYADWFILPVFVLSWDWKGTCFLAELLLKLGLNYRSNTSLKFLSSIEPRTRFFCTCPKSFESFRDKSP